MSGHEELLRIADAADRIVLESRLRDVALIARTERRDRLASLVTVMSRLPPGGYLVGCGPYSCGLLPLTVPEIVLGRPPTPLEKLPASVADYTLNDAVWLVPREVSRIHARIIRRTRAGRTHYTIEDCDSSTGTFVNSCRVASDPARNEIELSSGNVITLGPSGVNGYIFLEVFD